MTRSALAAALLSALAACGGSSSPPPPPRPPGDRTIELAWNANHEAGVNSPGGGYVVNIDGGPDLEVPYVSGAFAPTTLTTTMYTGSYQVAVRAYAALRADGSTGVRGTVSDPTLLTIQVP